MGRLDRSTGLKKCVSLSEEAADQSGGEGSLRVVRLIVFYMIGELDGSPFPLIGLPAPHSFTCDSSVLRRQ